MNNNKIIENYTRNLKEIVSLSTDELLVEVLESFLKIERTEYLSTNEDKGNGFYPRVLQVYMKYKIGYELLHICHSREDGNPGS